jgi:hypothetical protein
MMMRRREAFDDEMKSKKREYFTQLFGIKKIHTDIVFFFLPFAALFLSALTLSSR